VCVHGVNGHGRRFRRLAEERLADRFRVLAPDLRGHGTSDWDPPWTIATHAHDLLETLDDAGVRSAQWVGHSFGARMVLELAALAPERIERAALLDPAIQVLPHVAFDFPDGKFRFRYCQSAVVSMYSELCTPPPAPETLRAPTLLLYAPDFGLVRKVQLEEYRQALGDTLEIVEVPGGHIVYWDAYEETAAAVEAFLEDPRA
jgi:lipase